LTLSNQEIKNLKLEVKKLKEENDILENQIDDLAKDKVTLKK